MVGGLGKFKDKNTATSTIKFSQLIEQNITEYKSNNIFQNIHPSI